MCTASVSLKTESDRKPSVIGKDQFVGRQRELAIIDHALDAAVLHAHVPPRSAG